MLLLNSRKKKKVSRFFFFFAFALVNYIVFQLNCNSVSVLKVVINGLVAEKSLLFLKLLFFAAAAAADYLFSWFFFPLRLDLTY